MLEDIESAFTALKRKTVNQSWTGTALDYATRQVQQINWQYLSFGLDKTIDGYGFVQGSNPPVKYHLKGTFNLEGTVYVEKKFENGMATVRYDGRVVGPNRIVGEYTVITGMPQRGSFEMGCGGSHWEGTATDDTTKEVTKIGLTMSITAEGIFGINYTPETGLYLIDGFYDQGNSFVKVKIVSFLINDIRKYKGCVRLGPPKVMVGTYEDKISKVHSGTFQFTKVEQLAQPMGNTQIKSRTASQIALLPQQTQPMIPPTVQPPQQTSAAVPPGFNAPQPAQGFWKNAQANVGNQPPMGMNPGMGMGPQGNTGGSNLPPGFGNVDPHRGMPGFGNMGGPGHFPPGPPLMGPQHGMGAPHNYNLTGPPPGTPNAGGQFGDNPFAALGGGATPQGHPGMMGGLSPANTPVHPGPPPHPMNQPGGFAPPGHFQQGPPGLHQGPFPGAHPGQFNAHPGNQSNFYPPGHQPHGNHPQGSHPPGHNPHGNQIHPPAHHPGAHPAQGPFPPHPGQQQFHSQYPQHQPPQPPQAQPAHSQHIQQSAAQQQSLPQMTSPNSIMAASTIHAPGTAQTAPAATADVKVSAVAQSVAPRVESEAIEKSEVAAKVEFVEPPKPDPNDIVTEQDNGKLKEGEIKNDFKDGPAWQPPALVNAALDAHGKVIVPTPPPAPTPTHITKVDTQFDIPDRTGKEIKYTPNVLDDLEGDGFQTNTDILHKKDH